VIDKQRLAGAMAQKQPATQARVWGGGATASHMRAISTMAAATTAALIALIRAAMPPFAGRWPLAACFKYPG